MTVRTQLKSGGRHINHNEALRVRSTVKAGGYSLNHNERLRVRTASSDRPGVAMRRALVTTSRKDDRLALLVVRAGLRAGKRARGRG